MAVGKGISREELLEFLDVAMTMQGCPGEEWAVKAYAAYKDGLDGTSSDSGEACCSH
jgi:alkylhydroperoxidase/carboxymuconolactone decarboxylase family protein YurZ